MVNDDFDTKTKKTFYCFSDSDHKWIDADLDNQEPLAIGTSAKRMLTSSIGDEDKFVWKNESKVYSLAVKDRAAIGLGGHGADGVFWFAPKSRLWTSSDAYFPDKKLPDWVKKFNKSHRVEPSDKPNQYEMSSRSISDLTDLALAAVNNEKLGQHKHPDILMMSYSTHDYVGHLTGDNSQELRETLRVEDQQVARLISNLKKNLGEKKFIVVLTADHGAGVNIDEARTFSIPGGRQKTGEMQGLLDNCLKKDGIKAYSTSTMNVYLDADTKDKVVARQKVKECLTSKSDSVWYSFTREEILSHQVPAVPWLRSLESSYNPARGADVIGVLNPYWISSDKDKLNHETPYDYDSWVPLGFWWAGVPKKHIHRRVEVTSIAPTLARILLTRRPSGAEGEYLTEVLDYLDR